MSNVSGFDETELERLCVRLLHQTTNAFFCITANTIALQREIAEKTSGRFPLGEVQIIDFSNTGNDFRFSSASLHSLINERARIIMLVNFQLAGGNLSDAEFFQTLNSSRDGLAELPYVFVFIMPPYFRIKIARNAPDFNSFFWYRADFTSAEEYFGLEKKMIISTDGYSAANKELLDYYLEKYSQLSDYESKQALEILLKILGLNVSLRILHSTELNSLVSEFKKLLQKYENKFDDEAFKIASVFYSSGDYTQALEWYEKDLATSEKVLGKEHPITAKTYNSIASVHNDQGNYAKALEWFEKALAIREKVMGKEHPDTATTYNNIALAYDKLREYAKALEWLEKALAIREKVLGNEHPDTAVTIYNIAWVYYHQGEYSQALERFIKSYVILQCRLGDVHPYTSGSKSGMELTYNKIGLPEPFEQWLQKTMG